MREQWAVLSEINVLSSLISTFMFDTITIIGVGLLGGSLGLALKRRGLSRRILGVGRRPESLDAARSLGTVDETFLDLEPAVREAGLVVVCTPAAGVTPCLDRIRDCLSPGAVVTDVASTKALICAHVRRTNWPRPLRFIGSHPMAGSEKFGPEHADPNLYEGAVTFVERAPDQAPDARDTVVALWQGVGSTVVDIDPAEHDDRVARTSHVPHIAAAALAQLAAGDEMGPFVGNGFRDTTRIAEGRPEIWRDICQTNAPAILEGLDQLESYLHQVRDAITRKNGRELEDFFEAGRCARGKVLGE